MSDDRPQPPETDGQEQPAAAPDPLLQAVLGSIGDTGQLDPVALLMSQLAGMAPDDPRTGLLLRLLEQRRASPPDQARAEADEDPELARIRARREAEARRERARRIRELRSTVQRVYAELEALRSRNDQLAAALGACYLCFGSDPLCEECGGDGVPGSLVPEPSAYREFVVPAVKRMQAAGGDGRAPNPYRRPVAAGRDGPDPATVSGQAGRVPAADRESDATARFATIRRGVPI